MPSPQFDLIGTYAYYLRKVWVYALSAEGPLNSTSFLFLASTSLRMVIHSTIL